MPKVIVHERIISMNFAKKLSQAVAKNDSLLCVGLDPMLDLLPTSFRSNTSPLFAFNKAIIDSTADLVCAFKANSAFYEALGSDGINQLKQTADYLRSHYPHLPIILDAKRADIGNTNRGYVSFTFDYLKMDAVTLNPYLGMDALQPFLNLKDRGIIILCCTSNPGAETVQMTNVEGKPLYEHIVNQVLASNKNNNCVLVMGATYPKEIHRVREIVGEEMIFLVPGVGTQGGKIELVMKAGLNSSNRGLIINSSRSVIYASKGINFALAARKEASRLRDEINKHRHAA